MINFRLYQTCIDIDIDIDIDIVDLQIYLRQKVKLHF